MPIYEYSCSQCGKKFDALRTYAQADEPIACKNCGSGETHRAISLFNAQSNGKSITSSSGCNSCSGGSCTSCGQ